MGAQGGPGSPKADWYTDPMGRHQYRYWDGVLWTDHVADDGKSSLDPVQARGNPVAATVDRSASVSEPCKALRDGHCVVNGVDSGPCDWNPSDWRHCNVVIENQKYGQW